MGRRNLLTPYSVLTAGSMTGNLTSAVSTVTGFDGVCYQASWSGTPTGTFKVQGSIDQTNWTDLVTNAAAVGAAGTWVADLATNLPYLRVTYTATSGTGTLGVLIAGKSTGA